MKVAIVGLGLAGTMTAKALHGGDSGVEIEIFGGEPYFYYPRPNLIGYLAGRLPYDRLFAFPPEWYERQAIGVRLSTVVRRVLAEEKKIETAEGIFFSYDILCLADGASAFIPSLAGAGLEGVFTLRSLDDARALDARVRSHPRVVVVGGGLLGLEIGRALGERGADVTIVEIFPHLLPRQLDAAGAAVLQRRIEAAGLRVRTGVLVREILGRGAAAGLRLESGETIPAETVILAAGAAPNTSLARSAGLAVEKGVVVDDHMETSRPGIFAAGDGTQHRGRVYGIIPAAVEQARIAAAAILGDRSPYPGTTPSNTLKVVGIALTSAGAIQAETRGQEELRREVPEAGIYKKLVLDEGRLIGAVWLGDRKGADAVVRAVAERRDVSAIKHDLLGDDFDFGRL